MSAPVPERVSHPFLMYDMIREIPDGVAATLKRLDESPGLDPRTESVIFTGCGTSFFSAMVADQIARRFIGGRSDAVQSFELANCVGLTDGSTPVVGISHSGVTKTTVDALLHIKERGGLTLALTHYADSPITRVAHRHVVVGNSPDRSRCHTKCFVDHVAGAVSLLKGFAPDEHSNPGLQSLFSELKRLPLLYSTLISRSESFGRKLAERYIGAKSFIVSGCGVGYPVAGETALKLRESSFVSADGYELEQLLHGPWVSLGKDTPVILFVEKSAEKRCIDFISAASKIGVPVAAIAEAGTLEATSAVDEAFELPPVEGGLSSLLGVMPAYFFAYYSSVLRGNNPDMIRYDNPAYWSARQYIFPPGTH